MRRMRAALLAALLTGVALPGSAAAPASPAAGVAATVAQPRAFGHVLGDVLVQTVLLEHEGRPLTPGVLPPAGRVDLWLDRRSGRIDRHADGSRWLLVEYQLINAPQALRAIALPALQLATAEGVTLTVPAWPLSIAPLTPPQAFDQGDLQALRPDRAVPPLATEPTLRQLRRSLLVLAALLLAWTGWWAWRNAMEARRLPFARAWRELRRVGDMDSPQAWRIVHRALNARAGHVVHGASLPRLLAEVPWLQPLQPRLADFYRESTQRFFASGAEPGGAPSPYPLAPLCKALADAEKRERR